MFSTAFKADAKIHIGSHQAIVFSSPLSKKKIIEQLKEDGGIMKFITPDVEADGYNLPIYKDKRIEGVHTTIRAASCCAFTRDSTKNYLFPFHKAELESLGLTEDDLIEWLKFLNDMEVGFDFHYLGTQEATGPVQHLWTIGGSRMPSSRYPDNKFYWVLVPKFKGKDSANILKAYLHWVSLRYLINGTQVGKFTNSTSQLTNLPYYVLPRIAMHLHKEFGLSNWDSFLYAHGASNWFSGNSLAWTDSPGKDSHPNLGVSAEEFRQIWDLSIEGNLNEMLTPYNKNPKAKDVCSLKCKHDFEKAHALAAKEQWKEYIEYLDECYHSKNAKIEENVKKTANH